MKILKYITAMAALLTTWGAASAALEAEAPEFHPGDSHTIEVSGTVPSGTCAMQFSVAVPAGFTLQGDAVELAGRTPEAQIITNAKGSGSYSCVVYSTSNTPFTGGDGVLFRLTLATTEKTKKGTYTLTVGDVIFSDASGKETKGDALSLALNVTVPATSVNVDPKNVSLRIGETKQLYVSVIPTDAEQTVTWTSSDPAVATVSADGLVTATGEGAATVSATTTDGTNIAGHCTVTVGAPLVTSITLNPDRATITLLESVRLDATVTPSNAAQGLDWSSSDASIATVDDNGRVTPVALGSVIITARATDGSNVTATATVTVVRPLAATVTVDPAALSLRQGDAQRLTASVAPEQALQTVTWTTSDATVATVDTDGYVTAIGSGSAVITATSTDGGGAAGTCSVSVDAPLATGVTVMPNDSTIAVGEQLVLFASVAPAAAAQSVVWDSSNGSIATVAADGTVTATGLGTATITATATDGSGVKGTATITVVRPLATSVTVTPEESTIAIDETLQLYASVAPEWALQSVEWTSSDTNVATVDADGMVTAIGLGTTYITVMAADNSGVGTTVTVNVVRPMATGVGVTPESARLKVGETQQFAATVYPATALQTVTWSSSDDAVATVASDGLVTAVGTGDAVITATAADGSGMAASASVSVAMLIAASPSFGEYDGHYLTLLIDDPEAHIVYTLGDGAENVAVSGDQIDIEGLNTVKAWGARDGYDASAAISFEPKYYSRWEQRDAEGHFDVHYYLAEGGHMKEALAGNAGAYPYDAEGNKFLAVHGQMDDQDYRDLANTNVMGDWILDLTEVAGEAMPDGALVGYRNWKSIILPRWIKILQPELFGDNGCLGSIEITNPYCAIGADALDNIGNPDILIYAPDEEVVQNLKTKHENIIVGGRATRILLNEGNPFFAHRPFTALFMSYTKEFSKETGFDGGCAGWEAMALPFNASEFVIGGREIVPFASGRTDCEDRFWLYGCDDTWQAADSIKANTPYIVATPNNPLYDPEKNLTGKVSFHGFGCRVDEQGVQQYLDSKFVRGGSVYDIRTFTGGVSESHLWGTIFYSSNPMVINQKECDGYPAGGAFVALADHPRDIRTMEWILLSDTPAKAAMPIFDSSEVAELLAEGTAQAWVEGSDICILAGRDMEVGVHSLDGTLVRVVKAKAGETARIAGLTPGVYIAAGRKLLVK